MPRPSLPGRNDPCPCGSGRKFKQCCLQARTIEDSARITLRGAEGRVVPAILDFTAKTFGQPLFDHAWEDFFLGDDVPEDMASTPEFDTMFIPWLVLSFIADPEADEADPDWPDQPMGLQWLEGIRTHCKCGHKWLYS